jgi:antirestriction protein ArdC
VQQQLHLLNNLGESAMNQQKTDIYERVTRQIIEAMERGAGSYRMPWHVTGADRFAPANAASKRPYRGINVLLLWLLAEHHGYTSGEWATYNQWQALGAQVRKGEKAELVVFWRISERSREETDDQEEPASNRSILARGYHVFNAAQVDGYAPKAAPVLSESERVESAERFFAGLGFNVEHGGNRACYSPEEDVIHMPPFSCFRNAASYYSVLGHEATHASGAKHRLDRDLKPRFAEESYAMEELVAELGAAFLCSALGLANEPRQEHAAYLTGWLKVLRQDKRAIFTAASQAQKAVDWMRLRNEEQQSKAA